MTYRSGGGPSGDTLAPVAVTGRAAPQWTPVVQPGELFTIAAGGMPIRVRSGCPYRCQLCQAASTLSHSRAASCHTGPSNLGIAATGSSPGAGSAGRMVMKCACSASSRPATCPGPVFRRIASPPLRVNGATITPSAASWSIQAVGMRLTAQVAMIRSYGA